MGDRTHIRYTEAERRSFALVPETCPVVERALDAASRGAPVDIEAVLRKYGIEPTKNMIHAIHEIGSKSRFPVVSALRDVVMFQGTFPLRLALVRQVEREMRAAGEGVEDRSNYQSWIDTWALSQKSAAEDSNREQ